MEFAQALKLAKTVGLSETICPQTKLPSDLSKAELLALNKARKDGVLWADLERLFALVDNVGMNAYRANMRALKEFPSECSLY